MSIDVSRVVSRRAQCGEGPFWHAETSSVVWVDIVAGEILRTVLDTGETSVLHYPQMVGAAVPRSSGGLVAAVTTGFVGLDDDGAVVRRVDCLTDGIRMNDAKTDPAGTYWAGSCAMDFAPGEGGLWQLDADWKATLILPRLTQPNGLGWSPDGRTFYLVETQDRMVLSFAFDPVESVLDPQPTVLLGPESFPGLPDGLAIDSRGHLWIAEFAGSAVYEFTPDSKLVQKISIPTTQPTSCAFVGPALDQLWVTSAAAGLDALVDPDAGSIFLIEGHGATGLPVMKFRG